MKKLLLIACSLVSAAAVQAQIIHVPADYPTIQQGINAAIPGDTVLVSDGIYYEQINFMGKSPLMVASQFLDDGNESHIASTIIDGSQLFNTDSASVVYFVSGEDTTSILCGFTIQHGKGTYTPDNFDDRQGGGIWIADAGAKIIHNRITHNTLDDSQPVNGNSTAGAGIGGKYAEGDYWVIIQGNTIDSNTCISKYEYAYGGGVCICYNCRISDNLIFSNKCNGTLYAAGVAGGIVGDPDPSWNNTVNIIIDHNIISYNEATSDYNNANSGGVRLFNITTVVSDNEVSFNTVITNCSSFGGGVAGLALIDLGEGSVVRNNMISHNVSNCWGGGLHLEYMGTIPDPAIILVENNYFIENEALRGGAFSDIDHPAVLQNNIFSGNAGTYGGACYVTKNRTVDDHLVTYINNSFSGNGADNGGAIFSYNAAPLIFNCIFWQDFAASGREINIYSGSAKIGFSNIDPDGIVGEYVDDGGNMFEDPQFSDNILLTLDPSSQCIESGTERIPSNGDFVYAPEYDILGKPRPLDNEWDLGAYETLLVGQHELIPPTSQFFQTVYPNPANDQVRLLYNLPESSDVNITIYDMTGHLLKHLSEGFQAAGMHETILNLEDVPSGVYFYRLLSTVNRQPSTGKVVIVK